jgi:uncharacterized protein DUF1161
MSILSILAFTAILPAMQNSAQFVSCKELEFQIVTKIVQNGLRAEEFKTTIVSPGDVNGRTIVGTCEGGTKRIVYERIPSGSKVRGPRPKEPDHPDSSEITKEKGYVVSNAGQVGVWISESHLKELRRLVDPDATYYTSLQTFAENVSMVPRNLGVGSKEAVALNPYYVIGLHVNGDSPASLLIQGGRSHANLLRDKDADLVQGIFIGLLDSSHGNMRDICIMQRNHENAAQYETGRYNNYSSWRYEFNGERYVGRRMPNASYCDESVTSP